LTSFEQYPLLGVQQGFVLASGVRATTNTVPASYRIEGSFSAAQILEALGKVAQRHEALRTFLAVDGKSVTARVAGRLGSVADTIAVHSPRAGKAQQVFEKLMAEYLAVPFDLRHAPVWSGFLVKMATDQWMLGLTFAHVIIDGTSTGLIGSDLAAALGGQHRRAPMQLSEIAKKEAQTPVTPDQGAFWRSQYQSRRAIPATWAAKDATYLVVPIPTYEPGLVRQLDAVRRSLEISLTSLFGALAGVAGRALTGGDLMIGYATSQRHRPEVSNGNQLTVGTVHDHLPALAVTDLGRSFAFCATEHHKRRESARQFRLPSGHLAQIAGSTAPYDVAVNYGRFGAPTPVSVNGGGTVTTVPVEAIGPVNVFRATTAAPALAFIASPDDTGAIGGVMTGISGLFTVGKVQRYARLMRAIAGDVATNPSAPVRRYMPTS
jgi:hypothetical protein